MQQQPLARAITDVFVTFHELQIIDIDIDERPAELTWHRDGFVGTGPGLVAITCEPHTGLVSVTVEIWETPPQLDQEGWHKMVEVSVFSARGQLRVQGLMDDPPTELPMVSSTGPGWYMIRVFTTIPDKGADSEKIVLQVWPSPTTE